MAGEDMSMEVSTFGDKDWKKQDEADDAQIQQLLGSNPTEAGNIGIDFDDDKPFDQTNKADDAFDFGDISNDDLADDDDEPSAPYSSIEVPGLTDDAGTNDDDDLFGERASSPFDGIFGPESPAVAERERDPGISLDDAPGPPGSRSLDLNFDPEPMLDNQDPDIPEAAESKEDLLKAAWPTFQPGVIINWSEMLPNKKADWKPKKPARKPRALITTKLSLELDADQEKQFRVPGPATSRRAAKLREMEAKGLVWCGAAESDDEANGDEFDLDNDSESEPVGGFALQDIEMTCVDFAEAIEQSMVQEPESPQSPAAKRPATEEDEWDAEFMQDILAPEQPARKKRRVVPSGLPKVAHYNTPSFSDFEEATQRAAKRVRLDVNDPHLFLDKENAGPAVKRPRAEHHKTRRMANGSVGRDILARFNRSNDEAYEALKENHQNKVRATLGNIGVEHSMPALKLMWPYYNVRFDQTTETYHRPRLHVSKFTGINVAFTPLAQHKRRYKRGKAPEVYQESKDLVLGDNSAAVLFEYSERVPRVLSKFGMGNRVINYYRRVGNDDGPQRLDVGESNVLLPEDRSPFSIFGTVSPGETVATLHNEMYRAPIFKHDSRGTDFLCGRSSTGLNGSSWYLRKIDHLYVVGQTLPIVEVPGPHSRKVTNTTKNRMKMLAYRLIRKDAGHRCQLSDITAHIAGSNDTQNRQKLKDFLAYEKRQNNEGKGLWKLKDGEAVPDEPAIRAMIKPEEVCLVDAMQLGVMELQDAGYDVRNVVLEEEDQDDEAEKKGEREETLANKMAPWKTTKAFIDACAGKAMLQLHGEGDPTGHGLGFSFIRTSMKGGYLEAVQGPLSTSADAMEKEKRANGGHAYNVKKQEAMYKEGISEIWDKQRTTLSDPTAHDEDDVQPTMDEDERFATTMAATPAAAAAAAAHFDEGASQISGYTSASRRQGRRLEIKRWYKGEDQPRRMVVSDPVVIRQYMRRRETDGDKRDIYSLKPTGNADQDRHQAARIQKELARLQKNKARRRQREQLKLTLSSVPGSVPGGAGSPEPPGPGVESAIGVINLASAAAATTTTTTTAAAAAAATPSPAPAGTTRKCANCGQVGHIKTNKKLRKKDMRKLPRRRPVPAIRPATAPQSPPQSPQKQVPTNKVASARHVQFKVPTTDGKCPSEAFEKKPQQQAEHEEARRKRQTQREKQRMQSQKARRSRASASAVSKYFA